LDCQPLDERPRGSTPGDFTLFNRHVTDERVALENSCSFDNGSGSDQNLIDEVRQVSRVLDGAAAGPFWSLLAGAIHDLGEIGQCFVYGRQSVH